ncbi:hypothetical protein LXT21_35940 [Myxococcus sp. K38C18041901]|uniref:hypothetical protein n=1 Tax=Myxococcus guangdongensis TaxID=2906760 RepID=UPI0020A7FC06|nr:hypothetical protein [Myxococcus guangdongensis]MCP3064178.1 hypothetical protein [Myxococcus guangdongensis]
MRLLVMLVLVHGLVPSFGEAIELAVHYSLTGHVAHTELGESDLGDTGREHGCGPTQHHCGCCASQVLIPSPQSRLVPVAHNGHQDILGKPQREAEAFLPRLLRPPIAA